MRKNSLPALLGLLFTVYVLAFSAAAEGSGAGARQVWEEIKGLSGKKLVRDFPDASEKFKSEWIEELKKNPKAKMKDFGISEREFKAKLSQYRDAMVMSQLEGSERKRTVRRKRMTKEQLKQACQMDTVYFKMMRDGLRKEEKNLKREREERKKFLAAERKRRMKRRERIRKRKRYSDRVDSWSKKTKEQEEKEKEKAWEAEADYQFNQKLLGKLINFIEKRGKECGFGLSKRELNQWKSDRDRQRFSNFQNRCIKRDWNKTPCEFFEPKDSYTQVWVRKILGDSVFGHGWSEDMELIGKFYNKAMIVLGQSKYKKYPNGELLYEIIMKAVKNTSQKWKLSPCKKACLAQCTATQLITYVDSRATRYKTTKDIVREGRGGLF